MKKDLEEIKRILKQIQQLVTDLEHKIEMEELANNLSMGTQNVVEELKTQPLGACVPGIHNPLL